MTSENPNIGVIITKKAAADLSSSRWRAVKLSTGADTVAACTASTDPIFGILRNKPETNDESEILLISGGGESRIELGATLSPDDFVSIDSVGRAAADTSGNYRLGQLTKGGASGEIGRVILNPAVPKA